MMTSRYFAVRPKPALLEAIQRSGLEVDTICPELLVKNNVSRNRPAEADDVALIKATYITVFLNETFGSNQADRAKLAHQIDSHGFDTLWTIEVFTGCEDIDDLIADCNLRQDGTKRGTDTI